MTKRSPADLDERFVVHPKKELLKPTIEHHGPIAEHNMPCAVYLNEPAVMNCNTGIFRPSWKAQKEGYVLVKAPKWLRWLISKYQA